MGLNHDPSWLGLVGEEPQQGARTGVREGNQADATCSAG
jgi:hypothetical protein